MLKTQVQELEPNKITLTVEVGKEKVTAAYSSFFQKVAQKVNIPGFRRGKVPRSVLVKFIGPDSIKEQISDELVHEVYPQAILEANIHPINAGKIAEMDLREGEPFTFKAVVEVRPKLPDFSYHSRKIVVNRATVDESNVQKVLQNLREQFGKLKPLEDGVLEFNDHFIGRIEAKIDGQVNADLSEDKAYRKFVEEQRAFLPMKGMKAGETRAFTYKNDNEKDKNSEHFGKTIEFTVTVNNISRPILSDLDDDFAKEVGEFKSLDELKSKIREDLEVRFKRDADQLAFDTILKEISREITFSLPETMIERTIDTYIESLDRKWRQYGTSVEDYLKKSEKSMEEFRATFREKALHDTRLILITDEIADRENFRVSDSEYRVEVEKRARENGQSVEKLLAKLSEGDGKHFIENALLHNKIFDFLLRNNEIQYDMVSEEDINKGEPHSDACTNSH